MKDCPCAFVRDVMRSAESGAYATGQQLSDLLADRSAVGLKKYGVTFEQARLDKRQVWTHFLEEMLDGANYAHVAGRDDLMHFCLGMADKAQIVLNTL